jgi:hypothetical protein
MRRTNTNQSTTHSTATATESTPPAEAPAGAPVVSLQPPPAGATIPVPPSGTVPPGGAHYRAKMPIATELAALDGAIADLKKATGFAQIFGATAPPYAQLLQAFDVGNQWSSMRAKSAAWDAYCQTQEGLAWEAIRAMMDRLRPAFELAASGDATIPATMPGLASLLRAKKARAAKAVATKRANDAAVAKGEPPFHGEVGKQRMKRAQRDALAKANAKAGASTPPPGASAGAAPAGNSPAPTKGNGGTAAS